MGKRERATYGLWTTKIRTTENMEGEGEEKEEEEEEEWLSSKSTNFNPDGIS